MLLTRPCSVGSDLDTVSERDTASGQGIAADWGIGMDTAQDMGSGIVLEPDSYDLANSWAPSCTLQGWS